MNIHLLSLARAGLSSALVLLFAACPGSGSAGSVSPAGGSPVVGQQAPSLAVAAGAGAGADNWSELAGKVVIVDFWASWCAPCKEELPELEQIYGELKQEGLEIVGVSVDEEREDMERFLEIMPLSFTIIYDADHHIAKRWNPPKMPTSYVVDSGGKIAYVQEGYSRGDGAKLKTEVLALLSE
ncbi:MAG: redoxin domain-containing protein [Nannocystaceae bacterium]